MIEFRDDIERRFWGDIFARLLSETTQKNTGAYAHEMRMADRVCAGRAADEALIDLRARDKRAVTLSPEGVSGDPTSICDLQGCVFNLGHSGAHSWESA